MFGKECFFIIKSIKKTLFYILKILIKIGNVWERTLIFHKNYKKDSIIQTITIIFVLLIELFKVLSI
jgi:hypothetical protein